MAHLTRAYDYPGSDILPRVIGYVVVNVIWTNVGKYYTFLNSIFSIYKKGLKSSVLMTIYGSLIGLSKLGTSTIRNYVIPEIPSISDAVKPHLIKGDYDSVPYKASTFIRHRLLKFVTPILKKIHGLPDNLDEYTKYGFLGSSLFDSVVLDRLVDNIIEEIGDGDIPHENAEM